MQLNSNLLGLPAALILIITSQAHGTAREEQTPSPWLNERSEQDTSWLEKHRRRALSSAKHTISNKSIVGVMKMSDDPGEKFFPEYWVLEEGSKQAAISEALLSPPLRARDEEEEWRLATNASAAISYRPPFALHTNDEDPYQVLKLRGRVAGYSDAAAALAALEKRVFTCPTGTSDCSSIGAPNACCSVGETCFNITDTGLGSVGCCPNGSTCGGTISSCGSINSPCAVGGGSGYEPGGCCIPNYVCAGVGCVINPTLVVTVVVTQTFTASNTQSTVQTSTVTSTITSSTITTTNTALQTTLVCSNSMLPCPVNLGGGCCTSGFTCAADSSCIPPSGFTFPSVSTSSATGVAPIRPTTDASSSTSTSIDPGSCPTGFYACSAFYRGGCCRTGRDCQTTSCPPTSSTTIIDGTATVVVPVGSGASVATPSGDCASGWSTCAASVGGNCCPSGWECGTASCSSISPSQTSVLQKGSPKNGGALSTRLSSRVLALVFLLASIATCVLI